MIYILSTLNDKAVKQYGKDLQYASITLQNDKKIILEFINITLRNNIEIIIARHQIYYYYYLIKKIKSVFL